MISNALLVTSVLPLSLCCFSVFFSSRRCHLGRAQLWLCSSSSHTSSNSSSRGYIPACCLQHLSIDLLLLMNLLYLL